MMQKCIMGSSGGGEPTETVLWENTSTTTYFPQTTITLSDDLNNYDEVRFYVKRAVNDSTGADKYSATKLDYNSEEGSQTKVAFSSLNLFNGASPYYRMLLFNLSSGTSATISAQKPNGSGDIAYPVKITGVKYS